MSGTGGTGSTGANVALTGIAALAKKGGNSPTTGFRYYFTLLMGICRGPVDQVFLLTSGGSILWDGAAANVAATALFSSKFGGDADPSPLPEAAQDWPGGPATDNATGIPITKPDLYGGDGREGGMLGQMDVLMGAPTQVLPAKIGNALAGLRVSALRGVLTLFYDGEVCANNPYPKAIKTRVRRALKGWDGDCFYPATAVIMLTDPAIPAYDQALNSHGNTVTTTTMVDGSKTTVVTSIDGSQTFNSYDRNGSTSYIAVPASYNQIYAMNPAHIIYECCSNRDWGRGLDRALIDTATFTKAADQLFAEHFGLCLKWTRADDVDTFIQSVIDHIGGVVYTDKTTGLLCLRLLRPDYVVASLPLLDYTHGLLGVTVAEVSTQDAAPNEVIVKYHSPVLDLDREARAQNTASINALGNIFSVTLQYPGLPTSTLAVIAAQRHLKVLTSGMKRVTCKVDRRAYLLVPGDVIRVNAPDVGLPNIVLRIASIEDTVVTDGTITLIGVQDTFSQPVTPFSATPQSTFREPDLWPHPINNEVVVEASYRDIFTMNGQQMTLQQTLGAPLYDDTSGFLFLLAQAPTPNCTGFDLYATSGSLVSTDADYAPFVLVAQENFARQAVLLDRIGTTDTFIRVAGDFKPGNIGRSSAMMICLNNGVPSGSIIGTLINEEMVKLHGVTRGADGVITLEIGRGCVDTPAIAHEAGSTIWAYDEGKVGDPTQYHRGIASLSVVHYKGCPRSSRGTLPIEQAKFAQGSVSGRQATPYPGANFRVNGAARDTVPGCGPDLAFTWNHRNRLLQQDQLLDELQPNVPLEAGVHYDLLLVQDRPSAPALIFQPLTTASNFTGDHFTMTRADLAAAGFVDGVIEVIFETVGATLSARQQVVNIIYQGSATGYGTGYGVSYGG